MCYAEFVVISYGLISYVASSARRWAQSEIVGERFIRGIALALYMRGGVRVLRDYFFYVSVHK